MENLRDEWIAFLRRIADPVLDALGKRELKRSMPVEAKEPERTVCTHMEAFGRLLTGIAPWLELPADDSPEGRLRTEYAEKVRRAIASAVDPGSSDYLWSTEALPHPQFLVDSAFFAHGLLRAPNELIAKLDARTRHLTADLFRRSRVITPCANNWLLFSAMVETALGKLGEWSDLMRIDYALRQHEQWFKGDGIYGDGPRFAWDYYNSFVIQPMLLDVMEQNAARFSDGSSRFETIRSRMRRYAVILERMIAPDGTYPVIGRSIAYRCGAFQALAQTVLRGDLPETLSPAAVRGAMTAVIRRTLSAPGTFDSSGWLRIGLCGHQPGLGENYISTGSLYLASAAFLPLGLPPENAFWSAPAEKWTSVRVWAGEDFPADHAMQV